jgi:hypothetical protein
LKLAALGTALRFLLGVLSVWLVGLSVARADAALPVGARILISGCSSRFNEKNLQDQLRVELLAAGVRSVRAIELYADDMVLEEEPSSLATLHVVFPDCEEQADEVKLAVADRKTGRHLERKLVISDVPDTMRARAIGLALTELLRSEWQKLSESKAEVSQATDGEAPPPPAKLRASQVVQEDAERIAREAAIAQRFRIEWLVVGRLYSQTDGGDLSTSLAISKLLTSRARLQVGGSLAGGAGQGTDAHLFQATGRVLLALVSRTLNPSIEVGALLEAGWASLNGIRDGRHNGAIITAGAHATLRVAAAEAMETLITVQAGYVVLPMTARPVVDNGISDRRIGFAGPTLGIGLGIASWL